MKLYHAAVYTNSLMPGQSKYVRLEDWEKLIFEATPNILESYHYVHSKALIQAMRNSGRQVFIDSGAFSAHTLGVKIDIRDYCKYIHENRDLILCEDGVYLASVLDGIGDPLETWRNQLAMESMGATPLPCFHFGEDDRYLEWYISRYPYITIGGLVGKGDTDIFRWLDRIWNSHLLDKSGNPRLKVHAFGVTRIELMKRYPWHSVDSSSWIQYGAFGHLFFPEFGVVTVSTKAPSRHEFGRHLTTLSEPERAHVLGILSSKGFDFERLSTLDIARATFNCQSFQELNVILNQHFAENAGKLDCMALQQLF